MIAGRKGRIVLILMMFTLGTKDIVITFVIIAIIIDISIIISITSIISSIIIVGF